MPLDDNVIQFFELNENELLALNNLIMKKCGVSLIMNETSLNILNPYYMELYAAKTERFKEEFKFFIVYEDDIFVNKVLNEIININKDIKYFLIYILIDTYIRNYTFYDVFSELNIKDITTIVPSFRIYMITEMHVFVGFKDIEAYYKRPLELNINEYLIAKKIFIKYLETIEL